MSVRSTTRKRHASTGPRPAALRVRPRLYAGTEIAIGPGKAALLRAIDTTGSIRLAAGALDMSYDRAWRLVRTMNDCFATPLVTARRGGSTRGEARLTPQGKHVLLLYLSLVDACTDAAAPWAAKLHRALGRSR